MNALIVYYSLEGNTRLAAEKVAQCMNAETLELIPKKAYPSGGLKKFLWGGKSALMKETPELEPYHADLADKEWVILGTPVWASTFAPPLRSFIEENDLSGKRIALVACSASGNAEKCFASLKNLLSTKGEIPTLSLVDPKTRGGDIKKQISDFCNKLR